MSRAGSEVSRNRIGARRTTSVIVPATVVAGYAGCSAAIVKLDLLDRLPEIDCPALVIVGAEDQGTPPEMARQIHANLRGSELLVIPSAAHISNIEQAAAFNQALLGFLARHKD